VDVPEIPPGGPASPSPFSAPLPFIEHGAMAYRADFILYGSTVAGTALFLLAGAPHAMRFAMGVAAMFGLCTWTVVEYLLHRFVLHRLPPFKGWHEEHHLRPAALLCTPTLMSAGLILALIFVPSFLVLGAWKAGALTEGLTMGYFGYAVTHHAIHHWRPDSQWLRDRKRWHALHHLHAQGRYGVTSAFWDRVFGAQSKSHP
jgi:sterol desaturase/sphingolipid hydroxylase (fatty acid hydroxylase superfamily)